MKAYTWENTKVKCFCHHFKFLYSTINELSLLEKMEDNPIFMIYEKLLHFSSKYF